MSSRSKSTAGNDPSSGAPRTVNIGIVLIAMAIVVIVAGAWLARDQLAGLLPGEALGEDVLATVNGEVVTVPDVDLEFAVQSAIQAQLGREIQKDTETIQSFRRDLLDQVVDQRLLLGAATAAGIQVTDQELDAELPKLGEGYGIQTEPLRAAALAAGVTEEQFREWARRSLAVGRYLKTEGARELGLQSYRDRGYTEEQMAAVAVKPSDVASMLQRDADVRFHFGGGKASQVAAEGEPAPDFTLTDLQGNNVSLSDYRGKPVMINYWATWCTPCKAEMPMFASAYERNKDKGLVLLALDVQEKPDTVQPFVAEFKLPFQVLLDDRAQAATLYRVRGLPSSYFVNADGVLVKAKRGAVKTESDLLALLQTILPEAQ